MIKKLVLLFHRIEIKQNVLSYNEIGMIDPLDPNSVYTTLELLTNQAFGEKI